MKNFLVTQQFAAPSDLVNQTFRTESTWRSFAELPFVGSPKMQAFTGGEPTEIAMSYQVSIDLPPLAEMFIDPGKLTFVELTRLYGDGTGSFEIVPDHYGDLLAASGLLEIVPFDNGRCERLIQGSVDVSLGWSGKLFESPVEDAIITGLKRALLTQAEQITVLGT